MRTSLDPHFEGVYKPDALANDLTTRVAARVKSGIFPGASPARNRYEVLELTSDSMRFRSIGLLAGINVGLNDVRLQVDRASNSVRYTVEYWTWASYGLYLCLAIALVAGIGLLTPLAGVYLFPKDTYPSTAALKFGIFPMVIFWGLIWPWILILMHKAPAARCLTRILDEVNGK
jgi:hypothetical protein